MEGWWRGWRWLGRTVPHRTVSPQYRAIHTATYRSKAVPHRTDIKQPCSRIPARGRFQQFMVRCFFGAKSFGVLKVVTTCWILQTPSGTE